MTVVCRLAYATVRLFIAMHWSQSVEDFVEYSVMEYSVEKVVQQQCRLLRMGTNWMWGIG